MFSDSGVFNETQVDTNNYIMIEWAANSLYLAFHYSKVNFFEGIVFIATVNVIV